ncbi:MAG: glycosyltransferase family 1 protein [Myxococcaceae bacterium]|nr:glycosyltransferase family 1 protein [Myxococcaceae bacterium]
MKQFLLAAHPTVGHTQALRAVGRELLRRGHRVRFAIPAMKPLPAFLPVPVPLRSAEAVTAGLQSDGFELVPLPLALSSGFAAWMTSRTRGYDELDWAMRLFAGEALPAARALLEALSSTPDSIVVADCFHFGAWMAAEVVGARFVPVFHSGLPFPAPGAPPFGSPLEGGDDAESLRRLERLVDGLDAKLAVSRRAVGLGPAPRRLLERPYGSHLNVLTTFEAFELPRPDLARSAAGPLLWAGPCIGPARAPPPFPWEQLERSQRPVVYVSLGTVFNDQPGVYRVLLEGVQLAGARAVVAAGASLEALRRHAGPEDILVRFAPQVELLARVQAAVVHGGNNSTNEALRAGVPILSVPFGGEQVANARRAVTLGVARALAVGSLSAQRVADALRELLSDAARARSRRLASEVPLRDGAAVVATALEGL